MARVVVDVRCSLGGGIARFGAQALIPLARELVLRGHSLLVLTEADGLAVDPGSVDGEVFVAPAQKRMFSQECQAAVAAWRADVCYSVNYLAEPFPLVRSVLTVHDTTRITHGEWCTSERDFANRCGPHVARSIRHLANGDVGAPRPRSFQEAFGLAARRCWSRASRIATVSDASRAAIATVLGEETPPIDVVGAGLDHLAVAPRRPALPDPQSDLIAGAYFLVVGQVQPHKRVEWAVDALCAGLGHDTRPIPILLVGGFAEQDPQFLARIQHHVRSRLVVLVGRVRDDELRWLYENAVALLVPSISEGFCLPASEALMSGCPVIASDIPVLRELLGDAAMFFSADRPEHLVLAAREAVECRHRRPGPPELRAWREVGAKVADSIERAIARAA